jgi:hypothetical protein
MSFSKRAGVPTIYTTYSISKAILNILTVYQASDLGKEGRGVIVIVWIRGRVGKGRLWRRKIV